MNQTTLAKSLKKNTSTTPCFITDTIKLQENVELLGTIQERTGAKVLLALKAFSQYSVFPLISRKFSGKLYGCCASSPYEAQLAFEEFQGEVHAFAAAYSEKDITELIKVCDHILFNSFQQLTTFQDIILSHNAQHEKQIEIGLRINPEHSEGALEIYNPCSPHSRLGIRKKDFKPELLQYISGLHFHTLCEQNSDALANTLAVFEANFSQYLHQMKWVNFGGGHHITREDYDIDLLCSCISRIQEKYHVQVYLEPGEALALNAGYLISTVLDIVQADMPIAILDCSAACHMPDVLEMPYTPQIFEGTIHDSSAPVQKNTYRLAGKSCLAGDVIGEYNMDCELRIGSRIIFKDMAIYSMVKTNTFNGLALPSIARYDKVSDVFTLDKEFSYFDFKSRL